MHRQKNKNNVAQILAQSFMPVLSHIDGCAPVVITRRLIEQVPDGRLWDPDAKRALFCRLHDRDMLKMTPAEKAMALGVVAARESSRLHAKLSPHHCG